MDESKLKILLIEDDKAIAKVIVMELEHQGHLVLLSTDGRKGLEEALNGEWDVILLDIMLPQMNGYDVCRTIRNHKNTPLIMLTAKDEVQDKVFGLDLGADDYLTKPFVIAELTARIRAVIRRKKPSAALNGHIVYNRELELDEASWRVLFRGEEITLTKKEFELLAYLMTHAEHVLTRDKILENVWGYDYFGDTNVVDVYVRFLRQKLDEHYGVHYLHTIRGVGYVLRAEE